MVEISLSGSGEGLGRATGRGCSTTTFWLVVCQIFDEDDSNRQVTIEMGNETLQIKMANQTTKLDLGKSETEAMQSIELKVGQSSVKLDQAGVTIDSMMIQIEGNVQTQLKGVMTQINGDAMLKMQGGITMIN